MYPSRVTITIVGAIVPSKIPSSGCHWCLFIPHFVRTNQSLGDSTKSCHESSASQSGQGCHSRANQSCFRFCFEYEFFDKNPECRHTYSPFSKPFNPFPLSSPWLIDFLLHSLFWFFFRLKYLFGPNFHQVFSNKS